MQDLKELLELAKSLNISVNELKELILLIEQTNPELLQKKLELKLRGWGIIIGGSLSIISLLGAIGLTVLGSFATVSVAVIIALIFAAFIFAGGTFALSTMQNVTTKEYAEMVKEIIAAMKKEEKTPLEPLPLKDAKPREYEPIHTDLSQKQDGNK